MVSLLVLLASLDVLLQQLRVIKLIYGQMLKEVVLVPLRMRLVCVHHPVPIIVVLQLHELGLHPSLEVHYHKLLRGSTHRYFSSLQKVSTKYKPRAGRPHKRGFEIIYSIEPNSDYGG